MQLDGFLDTLLGPLINIILSLMKIVINTSAKIVLIPWLTPEDAADAEQFSARERSIALINSNKEMEDVNKQLNLLKNLVFW